MTSTDHPTATITPAKSTRGQSGHFGSEWVATFPSESLAVFIGMRSLGPGRYFRMHLVGYFEGVVKISCHCRCNSPNSAD